MNTYIANGGCSDSSIRVSAAAAFPVVKLNALQIA